MPVPDATVQHRKPVTPGNCIACSVWDADSYVSRRQTGVVAASPRLLVNVSTGVDEKRSTPYHECMATQLTPEEAIERARRLQDERLNAVRGVAEARQALVDVREETDRELSALQARIAERIANAEREDVRAYSAAVSAGWTADELRKIGFSEPDKKARVRRRSTRKPATRTTPDASPASEQDTSSEG